MGYRKQLIKQLAVRHIGSRVGQSARAHKGGIIRFAVVGAIILIVGFVLTIALAAWVVSWVWNSSQQAVQTNPTISSLYERSKEELRRVVPNVPSDASDFITNSQIDTAKLRETYVSLPENTRQVWKQAMESSVAKELETATGDTIETLRQLRNDVQALQ